MTLNVSQKLGELLTLNLAASLGFGSEITADELSAARSEAFSSANADEFAPLYLRSECMSKYSCGASDLSVPAIRDFLVTEQRIGLVNERLVDPWSRPWLDRNKWVRARGIVHDVLGAFPWELFPRACDFGPGASVGLSRHKSQRQNKWDLSSHITEAALPYFWAFSKWTGLPALSREMRIAPGNKVTTVPKNWKTDRTIAIEPDWNMFFQKGVGRIIRSRLQRFGLLHRASQEKARMMAKEGSATGLLATIDLSSASDSISLALCEALLPADWFKVLIELRSDSGALSTGEVVTYSKISSMGNGFTFELETLLFYALTLAVCGKENRDSVHVYGDDIICPTVHAPDVMILLFEAGFYTNEDKTFVDGPFRESCGGHYYEGTDVTPFYHRRTPQHVAEVCVLANHITMWCANRGHMSYGVFEDVHAMLRRRVPRKYRGPFGVDGVLWSEWDAACPTWVSRYQAWKVHRFIGKMDRADPAYAFKEGSLLMQLWSTSDDTEASLYERPLSGQYRQGTVYTCRTQWNMLPVR